MGKEKQTQLAKTQKKIKQKRIENEKEIPESAHLENLSRPQGSVFVMLRLDYCNSILAGFPKSTLAILQHIQNAAARLVLDLKS